MATPMMTGPLRPLEGGGGVRVARPRRSFFNRIGQALERDMGLRVSTSGLARTCSRRSEVWIVLPDVLSVRTEIGEIRTSRRPVSHSPVLTTSHRTVQVWSSNKRSTTFPIDPSDASTAEPSKSLV